MLLLSQQMFWHSSFALEQIVNCCNVTGDFCLVLVVFFGVGWVVVVWRWGGAWSSTV